MKKWTKGMLIAAGFFASVGTGLCIGGVAMGAVSDGSKVMDQIVTAFKDNSDAAILRIGKTYTYKEKIDWENVDRKSQETAFSQEIDIDVKYEELIFQEYDGENIKIDTLNDAKGNVTVKEENGKLTIKDTSNGVGKNRKKIIVSVPSGKKFKTIHLAIDAGTIDMEGKIDTEDFSVEVGAGEFTSDGKISTKNCTLQVGAGSIDLEQMDVENLNADCGTGEIDMELSGKETDYNYELSCGMGEISIGESDYSGLGIEKTISNVGAGKNITLNCGMGEIDVEFLEEE